MFDVYQRTVLAALLHDVGKLAQRARLEADAVDEGWRHRCLPRYEGETTHEHALFSGRWVRECLGAEWKAVERLVLFHHRPEECPQDSAAALVVSTADWVAGGERMFVPEGADPGLPRQEPIVSIFFDGRGGPPYFRPSVLSPSPPSVFPIAAEEAVLSSNPHVWRGAWNDLKEHALACSWNAPFETVLERLLSILRVHLLRVPAYVYRENTSYSLYSHSHVTAAVAACLGRLWLGTEEILALRNLLDRARSSEDPALNEAGLALVGGELDGADAFEQAVGGPQAISIARGRALYLELVMEAAARRVLDALQLPWCCALSVTTRRFLLLAPLYKNLRERLGTVRQQFEDFSRDAHGGLVGISLAWVPLLWRDFLPARSPEGWATPLRALDAELRRAGRRLPAAPDLFDPFGSGDGAHDCPSCGEASRAEGPCIECREFGRVGTDLSGAASLAPGRAYEARWTDALHELGREVLPIAHPQEPAEQERLNAFRLDSGAGTFRTLRWTPTVLPRGSEGIASLSELARRAGGWKNWGALAARLDAATPPASPVPRMTWERNLEFFFGPVVGELAVQHAFEDQLALIESGIEGVLAIGTWDALPRFAARVREEFARFTGGRLTLSACVVPAPEPQAKLGDVMGEARHRLAGTPADRLNLWGHEVSWRELASVEGWAKRVRDLVRETSKTPLRMLGEASRMLSSGADWKAWRVHAAFHRVGERYRRQHDEFQRLSSALAKRESELRRHAGLVAEWAELLTWREHE